jgi:hypothetical protein
VFRSCAGIRDVVVKQAATQQGLSGSLGDNGCFVLPDESARAGDEAFLPVGNYLKGAAW